MKTIIAGSRDFTDREVLNNVMEFVGTLSANHFLQWGITEVLCGEAKGVDTLGKEWAQDHNIPVNTSGMADADMLVVIWNPAKSKGSATMFDYACQVGLPVVGYNYTQGSVHLFNINL